MLLPNNPNGPYCASMWPYGPIKTLRLTYCIGVDNGKVGLWERIRVAPGGRAAERVGLLFSRPSFGGLVPGSSKYLVLEPELHRKCADHYGGKLRHRWARSLLLSHRAIRNVIRRLKPLLPIVWRSTPGGRVCRFTSGNISPSHAPRW